MDAKNIEQFVERVPFSGCWIWMRCLNGGGYSRAWIGGRMVTVHRWLYEQIHGPVGTLDVDHLCRVRCCINPAHMEAVTRKVNLLRGIRSWACKCGNAFDSIVRRKTGDEQRRCLRCHAKRNLASYRSTAKPKLRLSGEEKELSRSRSWWLVDLIPYPSLQAVADATGMSRAAVYQRFRSKNFANYVGPASERYVAAFIAECSKPPEEA
jgi:hypothetical protein